MNLTQSPSRAGDILECFRVLRSNILSTRKSLHHTPYKNNDRHLSTLPRISPQNLKTLSLPQRLSRNLHPLLVNNPLTPPTHRLEPLPPNLCDRHSAAPAFTLLLVEALTCKLCTLVFETCCADPSLAIPLRCVRGLTYAGLKLPVELVDERG
jgi:hypothetical protein